MIGHTGDSKSDIWCRFDLIIHSGNTDSHVTFQYGPELTDVKHPLIRNDWERRGGGGLASLTLRKRVPAFYKQNRVFVYDYKYKSKRLNAPFVARILKDEICPILSSGLYAKSKGLSMFLERNVFSLSVSMT